MSPGQQDQSQNGRPRWSSILFVISLLLVVFVPLARWFLFENDHQVANLAGAGLCLFAGIFAYAGTWLQFATTCVWKTMFLVAPLAIGIAIFSMVEWVGVTGEVVPVFRFRSWVSKSRHSEERPTKSATLEQSTATDQALNRYVCSQFLGNARDGVIQSDEFSVDWKAKLPEVVWKKPVGAGWSGFAVGSGLAITLEQRDGQECLTAFGLSTGDVIWRISFPGKHFHALGGLGPRATPTIHDGNVFAQTALGIVLCAELETGKIRWQQDLLKLAGIDQSTSEKSISWGRSGSPLVFDNQVVVPFGSKSDDPSLKSLIAFDLESGNRLWTGGESQISYASPMLLTLCGVRQIVSVNEGCATGHNPTNGNVLWTTPWPSKSNGDACASKPVAVDDRRILLGKGYALGSKLVEISHDSDSWKAETIWSNTRILKTKFTSAIHYKGLLYGLSDGVLECINPADGARVWRGKRYGQGQAIIVNGCVLVTAEDGRIALVPTHSPNNPGTAIAEMQVLEGITWNVPAVAGPFLLVRNGEHAVCLKSQREVDNHDPIVSP